MSTALDLQRRAKRRLARVAKKRRDPRYQDVLGRFVQAGVLLSNQDVALHRDRVSVADVIWAGSVEPRMLELLPALLVKRPALFVDTKALPADLASVVQALRANRVPPAFRGIPGRAIYDWLPRVGHKNLVPSRMKSFRFTASDLQLLEELKREYEVTETELVRRALRLLADRKRRR